MKNKENNTAVQPKTYLVYQDKYTTGYQVYDPTNENSHRPNKEDIIEQFEAEEGAGWYSMNALSIRLDEDDIEDSDYTIEDLYRMGCTELYNAVCEIHPNIGKEFADFDKNGSTFVECPKDFYVEAYDFNGEYVTMEVKFKFQVVNGEVVCERVK